MYGSSLRMETLRPRALSSRPMLAAVIPLPSEEVTPPVTKTYFDMGSAPPGGFLMLPEWPFPGKAGTPGGRSGVRRRRHEAPGGAPVRGGRCRPLGHRDDRAAGAANAVGRLQPGPAARRRDRSRR